MKTIFNFIAILFFLLFGVITHAQNKTNYEQKTRLGFGLNVGMPVHDPYDVNLGADIRLQRDLNKTYSVTLTTGFSNMFIAGDNNDLGYIPVRVGIKGFVTESPFYLMGEVGGAFTVTNNYDRNSITLSPSIGYAKRNVDISLRYDHFNKFIKISNGTPSEGVGQFAVRIAYGLPIK